MKKFFIQIGLLLVLITGALVLTSYGRQGLFSARQGGSNVAQDRLQIGETVVNVEIADMVDERRKGLGGRESIASDSGMLFVFPEEKVQVFWMKGMLFALDFIWIRNSKVVDIIKDVPPPVEGQPDEELPRIVPKEPVSSVLEVSSGFVDAHGIKVGDSVEQLVEE